MTLSVSTLQRAALNSAVWRSIYWTYPVDDKGHENHSPVGRGKVSSNLCGKYLTSYICRHTELHEGVRHKGVDFTGKIVRKHSHLWCNKSSCPVCFISGWAARLARSMTARLVEGTKRGHGRVEHMMVSVPVASRDLPEDVMRKMARKALEKRGIIGGALIFHGFRPNTKRKVLEWSCHYHVLGYIRDDYDRCRGCVDKKCVGGDNFKKCNGFEARTRRMNKKDGCIVRVMDKREKVYGSDEPNVYGTAWYQLNHATIRVGIKRFQVVTWFGVVSYNKLKAPEAKAEMLCPVCKEEMTRAVHVGKDRVVTDVGDPNYQAVAAVDEFDSDGKPNYVDFSGVGRCL